MITRKQCKECKNYFEVNKWQSGKIYCSDLCKPGFKNGQGNSMSERALWSYIQRNLKKHGQISRVENAFYKGMPDVNYLIGGVEGWIELKYLKSYPIREKTIVKVRHFTREQKIWHYNRIMQNGKTTVILQIEKDYFLFANENVRLVGFLTKPDMIAKANKYWKNKINFLELKESLCNF